MQEVSYINPYLNDKIVHKPELYVGRSTLLRRIYAVTAGSGSISIVGPPRIGKGSLLNCLRFKELQLRYGNGYEEQLRHKIFVFVDLRGLVRKSWEDFFKGLNKEIIKQCQGIVDLKEVPGGSEGFSALLDAIEEQNYSLVLALDSFEKIRENASLSGPLPLFLRSEAHRVSYVIASTLQLHEIFPKEPISSPFYNIFLYREKIGVLARADAEAMVMTPARDIGFPFSDHEKEWVLHLAGGHPFIINFVCRTLFDKKASTPIIPIDLEALGQEVYQELFPHFKALWQGMDEREQEKFLYELHKEGTEEFYGSSLFRRFVKEQARGEAGLEIQDIKAALKDLSNPINLGKNRLRHLKVVENYPKNPTQASQSEIGLAIRETLFAAWDRLKGIGHRTDTAPEWESYNILFYSYFKHHIHHDQLAARLGITTRTLFRKKNVALHSLLLALQEMENSERP
jgi:hypothetical protein